MVEALSLALLASPALSPFQNFKSGIIIINFNINKTYGGVQLYDESEETEPLRYSCATSTSRSLPKDADGGK